MPPRSNLKPSRVHRHLSPATPKSQRQRLNPLVSRVLLPANLTFQLKFPWTHYNLTFSSDFRSFGESILLLATLLCTVSQISDLQIPQDIKEVYRDANYWACKELLLLATSSFCYMLWTHTSVLDTFPQPKSADLVLPASSTPSPRPASPRLVDGRDLKRPIGTSISNKSDFGYIWMSVPKNYRESRDDGIFTALLLGPIIACALLVSSFQMFARGGTTNVLPAAWRVELPITLNNSLSVLEALIWSRYSLINLSTICSTILLFHVCSSWWLEGHSRKSPSSPEGERSSVPRSEGRRTSYYILFTLFSSAVTLGLKVLFWKRNIGIWQCLNYFEIMVSSLFFQFALYIALRLAHRGFTLGELGLVCFGGTAIILEFLNITIAKIWPITTPFLKTYRLPTPLLIFQIALIVGSFLTGFLLSPFLVLSRNNAQRPVHRLRVPEEKARNRRYYALGFYIGAILIVGGLIGLWTRWCLGNRDPWLWVIYRILEGRKKWSRPALLSYWALLGCLSVAGWNRQLARSRKFRPRNTAGENLYAPATVAAQDVPVAPMSEQGSSSPGTQSTLSGTLGMTFTNLPNLSNLPNSANVSNVLDAADKHVPTLGLNARRKFFHALAVVMFIPGVAVDPAFTHLSFSAAFALFIFTEYVRYFAIYPFGAIVHLFMNDFLDHRDRGTAILSHFYLLTGCAGSVWLEGPTHLLQFTGTLTLGVGDAVASIVGRRIGIHRWSPSTYKTIEGSVAFVVSIVGCGWGLRLLGYTEEFSTLRYGAVVVISSILEALSDQNDNLTLPLFMWSTLVLAEV